MSLEMQLVDQLEESIKDFERTLTEMFGSFIEHVQQFVNQLRELENQHHEKLSEVREKFIVRSILFLKDALSAKIRSVEID